VDPSALPVSQPAAHEASCTQVACGVCAFNPLCHSPAASMGAPSPVESRRRLAPGECLYHARSPHASIYAVRAGFLKASVPGACGTAQVVRFLLPGDVAGLEGYAGGVHETDAVALGDCGSARFPRIAPRSFPTSIRASAHSFGASSRRSSSPPGRAPPPSQAGTCTSASGDSSWTSAGDGAGAAIPRRGSGFR